jgi:hypothetical protein
MALTSATDTVQVVDITEDDEEEVMGCTDTEEGRLHYQLHWGGGIPFFSPRQSV